jgi:hypothetical protein
LVDSVIQSVPNQTGAEPYRLRERQPIGGTLPGFRVPGPDEFQGQSDFGTLRADEYRVKVKSYTVKKGADNISQYNPKGDPTVWYTLQPLHIEGADDEPMLDVKGQPINPEKTLLFFFSPYKMGLKPVVSKSRKFFASAMGIEVETPVEFDSEEALYDALVGKELIVTVSSTDGKNKITDSRMVRRRKQTAQPDAVAAAVATFDTKPVESSEDETGDDPF